MPNVEMITARYDLSPEEKQDLASEIAQTVERIETLTAERKAAAQDYKQRIDAEKLRLTSSSSTYQRGWEMREQPAVVEKDYAAGEVIYRHAETGLVLQVRPMAYEERQQHFEFEEASPERASQLRQEMAALFEGSVDDVLGGVRERVAGLEVGAGEDAGMEDRAEEARALRAAFAAWRDGGPAFTDRQYGDVVAIGEALGRLMEAVESVDREMGSAGSASA